MDVLPLPPRPNLQQHLERAKQLVKAWQSSDPHAVRVWATDWLEALAPLWGVPASEFVQGSIDRALEEIERYRSSVESSGKRGTPSLPDAQFLIARAHGFDSWAIFAEQVRRISDEHTPVSAFERAADAVVSGDLAVLASLLQARPSLVRERSQRSHHATLLHYVAANGVEDFRQRTPANTVSIAKLLLEAGAEVDALADTYGGGPDQTTLNLLVSSTHPAEAGLHAPLIDVLADFGAALDGVAGDGSPLMTALAFGYVEAAEALARRGARVDNLLTAAALGRHDLVASFVDKDGNVKPDLPLFAPAWMGIPTQPSAHLAQALHWATRFGKDAVVKLLGKNQL